MKKKGRSESIRSLCLFCVGGWELLGWTKTEIQEADLSSPCVYKTSIVYAYNVCGISMFCVGTYNIMYVYSV